MGLILVGLLLLFGTHCTNLNAQFVNNTLGMAFTSHQPFFNASVIKKHKIKSISGHFIHYKLGDQLRETDYFRKYTFNRQGLLIEQQENTLLDYKNDTSINKYKYDEGEKMTQFIHRDRNGTYGYFYEYDNKDRLINLEYRRNYNRKETGAKNQLGEETIVYSEKSTYKEFPKQLQRTVYNTNNIPYKDIFTYYNEDSVIIRKTERLLRTRETKYTKYFYNEDRLVDTVKVHSNRDEVQDRMYIYTYEDKGYLSKKEEFKNGELITKYAVLYNDDTFFIDDLMIQDAATNFIRDLVIEKYEYFDQ